MMKKIIPAILICALGGVVVLGLSGCFVKKYRVDYCGSKDCYTGAKDSYRAGAVIRGGKGLQNQLCHART